MYTETEKTTSVEKIPHFNDNLENRSEKAQADEYVNDCGTNNDADPHKFYGKFDWCG